MKSQHLTSRTKLVIFSAVLSLLFCLILFSMPTAPRGDDLVFHLNRIRSLALSIKEGTFYPYIFHNQNFGYGYASPLFYSNLFLYPAAFLNCIGFSVLFSYKILVFLCTFFSCLSAAYFLSNFAVKNSSIYIGIFFYIFSGYRITDCYARAALGEILSFIFLPLALCGIYYLFYRKSPKWWILTLGYSGLLLSHNITFGLACGIFAIFFLLNLKTIITDRKILLHLILGILFAIGLTGFFLFPMIEQLSALSIINYKVPSDYVLNILEIIGFPQGNYFFSPGIILLIVPAIYLRSISANHFARTALILSWGVIILTMIPIIWIIPQLSFIQFPWRLSIIACISLMPAFVIIIDKLEKPQKWLLLSLGIVCSFIMLSYQIDDDQLLTSKDSELNVDKISTPFVDNFPYCSSEVAGAEYLVNKTYSYRYTLRKIQTSPSLDYEISYNENNGIFTFTTDNNQEAMTYILPLTYYKGYVIEIEGSYIYPYPDQENNFITFKLESYDAGKTVDVYYKTTKIQKISSFISLLSSISLFIIIKKQRRIKI